jgi:prevent-host-death family protein
MIEVNVRELKSRLSHYLRKLEEGEQIRITRRGKTLGTIIPTPEEDHFRAKMAELQAKGIITWSGQEPVFPKKGVRMKGEGRTMAEMIIEDRG